MDEIVDSLFSENESMHPRRVTVPPSFDANMSPTNPNMTSQIQWCPSCYRLGKEMEEKYSKNFIALKQKILFTDNLIRMYQENKRQHRETEQQLQVITEKYNNCSAEKTLIQEQLELILSKHEPSVSEITKLQEQVSSLEGDNENLKLQLHAMDESRRIHEETLKVLKAEESGSVYELKKNHQRKIAQ